MCETSTYRIQAISEQQKKMTLLEDEGTWWGLALVAAPMDTSLVQTCILDTYSLW